MAHQIPPLWPESPNPNIRIALALHGDRRLTVVKANAEDALTQHQREQLLAFGFQGGDEGRYIAPFEIEGKTLDAVSRLLVAPLVVTSEEHIVTIKAPEQEATLALPIELRDAIGWWWRHGRRDLAREIEISETNHQAKNNLEGAPVESESRSKMNPDRVRMWVELALSGELNEHTEPVIGLAISRLQKLYGGDLPKDLDDWRAACQEFRSESTQIDIDESPEEAEHHRVTDPRPNTGERIKYWQEETDSEVFGTVIGWSEHNETDLFVMPDNPEYLTGMAFPLRRKVALSEIRGDVQHRLEDAQSHLTPEIPEPTSDNPADESQWSPAYIQVEDIPNKAVRDIDSDGGLISKETKFSLANRLISSSMSGNNPLLAGSAHVEIKYIVNNHVFSGDPELRGHDEDAKARQTEAVGVIRDLQLDWFNKSQPEMPDAHAPVLAVIPVATADQNAYAEPTPEIQAEMEGEVAYGIGFHPKFMWRIHKQLESLKSAYEDDPEQPGEPRLKGWFAEKVEELTDGARRDFFSLSPLIPARWSGAGTRFSKRYLFETQDDAKTALQDRFFRGQGIDRSAIENNEKAINLIAKLSDQSVKSAENIKHPLFWLLDQAEKHGDLPRWSRATMLAAFNVDLSKHTQLLGELALAAGITATNAATSVIKDRFPEGIDSTAKNTHRAHVHSIIFKGSAHKHMVGLGILSKHETRDDRPEFFEAISNETSRHSYADENERKKYASSPNDLKRLNNGQVKSGIPRGVFVQEAMAMSNWLQMITTFESPAITTFPVEETVTNTLCDDLKTNWMETDNLLNLAYLDTRGLSPTAFIREKKEPLSADDIPEFYSRSEADEIVVDIAKAGQRNLEGFIHTLDDDWLDKGDTFEKISKGIQLWLLENPHMQKLTTESIKRIAEDLTNDFINCVNPEALVMASKNTRSRIQYEYRFVTKHDVERAGFDRKEAMEKALMKSRASFSSGRGVRGATLDLMAILSPKQKEELSRMQDAQESAKRASEAPATSSRDDERTNTGLVSGFSIKDLRGTLDSIISKIEDTTIESQEKLIRKTRLWPAPDWVALRSPEDGSVPMEPAVALFWDRVRKNMVAKPPGNTVTGNKLYSRMAVFFRDEMPKHRTLDDLKTNGIPKILDELNTLRTQADAAGFNSNRLFGDEIGSNSAEFYINAQYLRMGSWRTNENTEWPAHLGKSRNHRQAADQAGPRTGAMPMLKKLERVGVDYRSDRDISEDELITTFGFSGVEYGESMSQKERTIYLNQAYDGFMDIARTLKVEPESISLGGTLGLAFGSRGRGGRNAALAHFEPTNNVINLTREKGAGSMAHEYGHSLANYFYRQTKGVRRGEGDIIAQLENTASSDIGAPGDIDLIATGGLRREVAEALDKVRTTINFDPETMGESELLKSAAAVDAQEGRKSKDKTYWSLPEELFARTFETWISHRLKAEDKTYQNDFLVRNDKLERWGNRSAEFNSDSPATKLPQLYPAGDHLNRLDQAYRELFATIKTEPRAVHHEHLGDIELLHMYSHDGNVVRLTPKEMGPLAFCAIREISRLCGDKVSVRFQNEILNSDGSAQVAGRFRLINGSDPDRPGFGLKGLIEFSHHMNLSAIYHEGFHYAQHCLFTSGEQTMLLEAFAPGAPLFNRLVETLTEQGKAHLIRHLSNPIEVQAYAFQEWVAGRLDLKIEDQPSSYFSDIKRLGQRIVNSTQECGFRNPEALFRAFYSGDLQRRADLSEAQNAIVEPEIGIEPESSRPRHLPDEPDYLERLGN